MLVIQRQDFDCNSQEGMDEKLNVVIDIYDFRKNVESLEVGFFITIGLSDEVKTKSNRRWTHNQNNKSKTPEFLLRIALPVVLDFLLHDVVEGVVVIKYIVFGIWHDTC